MNLVFARMMILPCGVADLTGLIPGLAFTSPRISAGAVFRPLAVIVDERRVDAMPPWLVGLRMCA